MISPMVNTCRACGLAKTRRQVVIGRGTMPASVVFIGEAPGVSEDLIGIPFVGHSGKLLDTMLAETMEGISYYITNTVLCHPPENREPTKEERHACKDWVIPLILDAKPRAIVFVGKVAERTYAHAKELKEIPKFAIFHPAYLLRNGGQASPAYRHNINILTDVRKRVYEQKNVKPESSKNRTQKRGIAFAM